MLQRVLQDGIFRGSEPPWNGDVLQISMVPQFFQVFGVDTPLLEFDLHNLDRDFSCHPYAVAHHVPRYVDSPDYYCDIYDSNHITAILQG